MKTPTQFRLSADARHLLERMAKMSGVDKTAMLEIIIREAAKKRGIKPDAANS